MKLLFLSLLITAGGLLSGGAGLPQGQVPVQDRGNGSPSGQSEGRTLTASRVISGTVLDPSGATIVGARVTLTEANGKAVAHSTTSNSGEFRFNKVSRGNYHIEVQAGRIRNGADRCDGRKEAAHTRSSCHVHRVPASGDFTNTAGTYTFGSLADYEAGKPSTYLVQRGEGHLVFLEKVVSGFIEENMRLKPNLSVSLGARYYWQNYFHDDSNNVAPRFGFAYAPSKNSKTVIRGGAGVFYDRTGPRPIADLLHFNGVSLLRFIASDPTYPVTPSSLVGVPTSVVVLDPRTRIPYTLQYSLGVERQVTAKSTFSATYVGFSGIDLFRSIDVNAPPPPDYLARPNPNLGQEREIQSEGYQKSNALELTFRGKPSKFFTGQVQYTLSKTYNNTSGITYFPANSYDPSAEWARSGDDRRHGFDLLGSVQASRFFTVGTALSLYSGKPVTITTGSDNNRDGIANDRPVGVPRNSLPGPGLIGLDVSVSHDFVLSKSRKEAPRLTVSLNSFNLLNHENDVTYVGVFGRAVASLPPRRMQLNLQFNF
jgi:hypothetical protein